MRPITRTYALVAASANGIALTQTPLAAGNLTINGGLASGGVVTLATAQHVSISCAGADSGRTFTVTGTDYNGIAITEAIAGSAGSITKGAKNFKTITAVAVDAATAGAVTAGILGELETPWIPLNHYANPFDYAFQVHIGTATFSIESTMDDVQDVLVTPLASTLQASGSVDVNGSSSVPATAVRLKVTSFTTGPVTFKVLQTGIRC